MKRSAVILWCGLFLLTSLGCATIKGERPKKGAARVTYTDFEDIQIPKGLKLKKGKSLFYESGCYRMGYFYYTGRVDASSLTEYFKNSMTASGWALLNNFKYRHYLLNFVKGDRSCIILIEDGMLYTKVHLWVGPLERQVEVK